LKERAGAEKNEDSGGGHLAALLKSQPKEMKGSIERKKYGVLGLSSSYKTYKAIIMAPGVLVFSDKEQASKQDPNSVDLSTVVNFTVPKSKGEANTRLILETGDELVKLRFRSVTDLEEWSTAFKLWKEYSIDYGMFIDKNIHIFDVKYVYTYIHTNIYLFVCI
jgi:hypothetical protein